MDNKNKIKIACVGDSITEGCNVPLELRSTESFPAQLQKMLGFGFEVRNYGYGGRTMIIETHPSRVDESWKLSLNGTFYTSLRLWQPDIIVIMLGTNDSKSRHWNKDQFISDYKKLVDEFFKLPSNPSIYICSAPCCFTEGICDTISAKVIREEVILAAIEVFKYFKSRDSNISFIDIYEATRGHETAFDKDGVHPLKKGMSLIAKTIYDSIKIKEGLE